jgi:pimeloyl-ACP methyl ester carboxylesterase
MIQFDDAVPGLQLAWREDGPADDGHTTGFLWLGGFMSDMAGTKAEALAAFAEAEGRPCLRFDYSGHGQSGGAFADGTISRWLAEALHMFRSHTKGPRVIVGSSMGAWLAALLLRALPPEEAARAKGLVLVAPAHDFTETLMWNTFSRKARAAILSEGVWMRPSAYGGPYPITRGLIEDGRKHLLLGKPFEALCPVHILQGDADADVPWYHAMEVYGGIKGEDARFTLVKGGDHRLSSPSDLALLRSVLQEMAGRAP